MWLNSWYFMSDHQGACSDIKFIGQVKSMILSSIIGEHYTSESFKLWQYADVCNHKLPLFQRTWLSVTLKAWKCTSIYKTFIFWLNGMKIHDGHQKMCFGTGFFMVTIPVTCTLHVSLVVTLVTIQDRYRFLCHIAVHWKCQTVNF